MNETEFIENIDAHFPYRDQEKANEIIKSGSVLSPNASFMVLHEICRAPNEIEPKLLFKYLEEWAAVNNHPLKKIVVVSAKALIKKSYIANTQAIEAMNFIQQYQGQYNALSIVYFSASDESEELDIKYDEITDGWEK
jgi:hypothetical protein